MPFGGTAPPGSRQALLYEFDGRIKYEDESILRGRTKGEVLEAQIKRENELRDMGYELIRFTWAELYSLDRLREKLERFGIPRRVRKPRRPK